MSRYNNGIFPLFRRSIWLSSCSWQNEGKGGPSQVQTGESSARQHFPPVVTPLLHAPSQSLQSNDGVQIAWSESGAQPGLPLTPSGAADAVSGVNEKLLSLFMVNDDSEEQCVNNSSTAAFRKVRNVSFLRVGGRVEHFPPLCLFLHMPVMFVVTPACCMSHGSAGLYIFTTSKHLYKHVTLYIFIYRRAVLC